MQLFLQNDTLKENRKWEANLMFEYLHASKFLVVICAMAIFLGTFSASASTAEIKALSAGAVTEVMTHLAKDFKVQTGNEVNDSSLQRRQTAGPATV
jgi:hypothetical protein